MTGARESDTVQSAGAERTGGEAPPSRSRNGMEDRTFHLPMLSPKVRSLNLANVATAVVYQAMRPRLGGAL